MTSAQDNESQDEREPGPLPTPSDAELLLLYAESSNREAFEELVRRHERKLFRYLRRYLGDAQLAEDVFQATFLQLHLKCRQFERGRALVPWLYQIATNQAIDLLRRNRRHKAFSFHSALWGTARGKKEASLLDFLENADTQPSGRAESSEDRLKLRSALETLPQRLREVLVLITYQGLKYREAADSLGIPLGTVKSRAHQAVKRLHNMLVPSATRGTRKSQTTSSLQKESP